MLCARHCFRDRGFSSEQNRTKPCLHEAESLVASVGERVPSSTLLMGLGVETPTDPGWACDGLSALAQP